MFSFLKLSKGIVVATLLVSATVNGQTPLLTNVGARPGISLNGKWQYIVDPYETGFYDYRWKERSQNDREAYWNSDVPTNKTDRKEHGYSDKYTINVPGDWNSQDAKFLYYEGTVWYKKSFDYARSLSGGRTFLYFGAVNYRADVYLNGRKLGSHKGGFTPFNFEVADTLLKATGNFLVVKVDNKRSADEIPTLNTDWWNFGGITRDVRLVEAPQQYIREYAIQLKRRSVDELQGWVKLNSTATGNITIEVPELKLKKQFPATGDSISFSFRAPGLKLWSPESPKRYRVVVSSQEEKLEDQLGFRTVEVVGNKILLNGRAVFLRGICLHEEIPSETRRAYSKADAVKLLLQAKALNANMVRLAHYPHNENMTRTADSLGILVWSEIPVYWTINFNSEEVLSKAKVQLNEMITRDRNRASIIIWSVGNETPVHPARTTFMSNLAMTAKSLDSSRLISAALEVHNVNGASVVDDPLGQYTDIVSVNEYIGWYGGLPSSARTAKWEVKYNKPFFISETGAETLGGFHSDSLTRWSEEYQEWYYREQVAMMKRMPENFVGLSPWILNDFRSPRRNNPVYQEGWNNKGLFDQKGNKKKAFFVLKEYYDEMEQQHKAR
ncbi:beta-glucuronidase [Segetibacter sp. 3557_3]|uniref:glycoside hydrolase family 2 protein n=1 Tax=Segetibacter sp. 3557_3 TaxID=2547429 RepID=UPI001058F3D8|nr:glycoside hydrolase family 2 TIM barrel-domain containing protein [Segetibacter sp. 3557_3]TDH21298.1 beta-glucuronidase [Segetibacter sp. 3557_3]